MIFFYNIAAYILFVLALPFLPLLWLFSAKRRANLIQRFGFNTGFENMPAAENRIWVHALSVGEVISAVPFVEALKKKYPKLDIVLTTSTKTGFDMADQLLFKKENPLADHLGYFPFDLRYCIKRVQRMIRPNAIVIVETDLWPNFLDEMGKEKIQVVLVNARMSSRSLNGFLMFKSVASMFFSQLTAIMAQSALDKDRFENLGIEKNKIMVSGNIKFDQPVPQMTENDIEILKRRIGIEKNSKVIVGGSTHEGEEKILLSVYKKLKENFSELIMILAPRDPKRAIDLQSLCKSYDISSQLYSNIAGSGPVESDPPKFDLPVEKVDVVLVDQMGVLSRLYSLCDVAFIGGSMVPEGGHNPLEAAAFAKPIFFGKDMSDFIEISEMLLENGGAKQLAGKADVQQILSYWLNADEEFERMGKKSEQVFLNNSGAVQCILGQIEQLKIVR